MKDSKIRFFNRNVFICLRLEGTMSQFRKLDMSNEEKDERIADLEAR